jgi:tetratricopeptide (TPR) repeat protein
MSPAARADDAAAQARFTEAHSAFDAGNYSQALQLFEQCVTLGMQGPAIYYNIGVAAYRSGAWERADQAFREVARTPAMASLAYYNLGLVALKRDDRRTARDWFERASSAATDEKLRVLAAQRLADLPAAPAAESPWSYYARAGVGHDDNVALRAGSISTPGTGKADSFAELLAAGSYSFLPSWRIDGAAGLMDYSKLDDFDQSALSLGVAHALPFDSWYLELGGYGTQLSLGGDVYERSAAVDALASKQFRGCGTLSGKMRLSAVHGEGDYSGLTGTRTELRGEYQWAWRALTLAAHLSAEFNDSDDEFFASHWTELGAEARWAPSPLWSFSAAARQRHTTHPEVPDTQAQFDDRRTALRLEATRTLWKQAQLYVRYEHERSQSDVELYDYARDWIAASIEVWR